MGSLIIDAIAAYSMYILHIQSLIDSTYYWNFKSAGFCLLSQTLTI
jgi:hypothetical protein